MKEERIPIERLKKMMEQALESVGARKEDAGVVADVLIEADMRGISSHGVARLPRYIKAAKNREINVTARPEFVSVKGATAILDAHDTFGQVAGITAMKKAEELARDNGISIVVVRHSSHFGFAGYFAELALPKMIGIAMTNSVPLVVPTFGRRAVLGTNPIAVAAPTFGEPWLMDFSTGVISRGKIEVYDREKKELEPHWAVDEHGQPCQDPAHMLHLLKNRLNGGINPMASHKGYGLAVMVDLFCGLISGASFGLHVAEKEHADIGHCFIAVAIEHFLPMTEFLSRMDNFCRQLTQTPTVGQHIYLHGEKENATRQECLKKGVILKPETERALQALAEELGIDPL